MFDLEKLKDRYEAALGYPLKRHHSELPKPYRDGNEVIYPISGIFVENPIEIAAIREPFVGILSATITVFAVPQRVKEAEKHLNDVAVSLSGSFFVIEEDGKRYTVAYSCQTCTVGEKSDIGWGCGEVFPITQVISYPIIESGLTASDVSLEIDGHTVPFLSLQETKAHTSSVYPDERGRGTTASEMSAYGIDFTAPSLTNHLLSEIFNEHLENDRGNRALCVGLTKAGESVYRLMSIVAVRDSVQPPQNVGLNVSLAEVAEIAAIFNDLWRTQDVSGSVASIKDIDTSGFVGDTVVFWGDGSADKNPTHSHIYTDGKMLHTLLAFDLGGDNYINPRVNDKLYGAKLFFREVKTADLAEGEYYLRSETYEGIAKHGGRICVVLNDENNEKLYYPIDASIDDKGTIGIKKGFTLVCPFAEIIRLYNDTIGITYKRRDVEVL